jgi:hypothetical protein
MAIKFDKVLGLLREDDSKNADAVFTGDAELTVGGITEGQAFVNATPQEMFDALLKQEKFPTLTNPSSTFTSSIIGLQEVNAVIDITFNSSFDSGSINPQYTADSPSRSGDPNEYQYMGTGLVTIPKTDLTDSQTVNTYTVLLGVQTWQGRVAYDEGPQPKSSYDNDYLTPLPAGNTSYISRSITGVYPFFVTTVDLTTLTKQSLQAHGSVITVDLVEEDGINKQKLEVPQVWGAISKLEQFNTLSGQFDEISIASFTQSSTVVDVNGTNIDYHLYTHNGSTIGERQLRFTF